ncbi:MAG: coenzyme F420-0:L-glutamate ligase [Nitriliruptoraceae bacterium]
MTWQHHTNPSPGNITIMAMPAAARIKPTTDLAGAICDAADRAGTELVDGDVVCVASKVVAIVEQQLVPTASDKHDRRALARQHANEIVADAPQVLVTRTHHGFVTANGGIDASNVPDGYALLLPEDPDASARRLRQQMHDRSGVDVAIVVTDTFGRPWRVGQTDVALGIAGMAALRDERGGHDLDGRTLEVTETAIADSVAAAADLVRSKASGTPFVLIRGVARGTPATGKDLVRDPNDDLFRFGGATAVEQAVAARRTIRMFDTPRTVDAQLLRAAIAAAVTAPAPHHTQPWRFIRLTEPKRTMLLDAMADQWRRDLSADGLAADRIERRIARSDAVLRRAPELLAAFVITSDAYRYPDPQRTVAERDLFILSGGAALQSAQIVLAAHGIGAAWISSTTFCAPVVQAELELDADWQPIGMLACGWPQATPPARGSIDLTGVLLER